MVANARMGTPEGDKLMETNELMDEKANGDADERRSQGSMRMRSQTTKKRVFQQPDTTTANPREQTKERKTPQKTQATSTETLRAKPPRFFWSAPQRKSLTANSHESQIEHFFYCYLSGTPRKQRMDTVKNYPLSVSS